jgi:molybdopterin molybdotransferase
MISVEEALQQILQHAPKLTHEKLDLLSSLGRVLAEDIIAKRSLPAFDNSAMDGFAVVSSDGAQVRPIIATIACGDPTDRVKIAPGQAARIMTGAPLPEGADAVIMQEEASTFRLSKEEAANDESEYIKQAGPLGEVVRFQKEPSIGQHVRKKGSDITAGEQLIAAGRKIGPSEIAAIASQGRSLLSVYRRPTVAIVSTGDELVELDEEPTNGKLVNSNAYSLAALAKEAGAEPIILGIARDSLEATKAILSRAMFADVIITSGGVSVGEFDYVKTALDALGYKSVFWKINMKPGKPVVFGTLQDKPVLGLPGNPASCQVSFELFVKPLLRAMMGHHQIERTRIQAKLSSDLSGGDRRHFVRAIVEYKDGQFIATPLRKQGSGEFRSLVGANALLDIAAKASLRAGDMITAIIYDSY